MKRSVKFLVLLMTVAMCAMPLTMDARKSSRSGSGTSSGVVRKITPNQFKRLVADYENYPYYFEGNQPVVVDFYADWCGWCKKLSPTMASLARRYAGKINFYSVDVNKYKGFIRAYNIQGLPSLLFISSSRNKLLRGYKEEYNLIEWCDWLLGY